MKLKRLPEDFRVEELPLVAGGERGRFTFYRLTKRGVGTLEAIEAVTRRWNLARSRVSYGGLKDRHALTVQYLTIFDGPPQKLNQTSLDLEPIGRLPHAYGPQHFQGNRFAVVLRDLGKEAADVAEMAVRELPRDGLPNYFDTQRFGSVSSSGAFVAEAWLAGDSERALRLAIAEPNPSDRPDARAEKAIVREFWNRWPEAKANLGRSHARSIITYLVDHPTDFRGAFARVRRDLRSLYFSAYQSHVWNRMLARLIEQVTRPEQRVWLDFKVARLPIHHGLETSQAAQLAEWRIPLPSSRNKLPEGAVRELALAVTGELGLVWEQFRVKHLKDVFFSKGVRPALFFPTNLEHSLAADDLYPKRQKLLLAFDLPEGAYATLVVKRVTAGASRGSEEEDDDESEQNDLE
jgi:tRNA pseudouridine13 synthase